MKNCKITNLCPKCHKPMEVREHVEITQKLLDKPFYYRRWMRCRPCRHMQMFEKYKVFNDSKEEDIEEEVDEVTAEYKEMFKRT